MCLSLVTTEDIFNGSLDTRAAAALFERVAAEPVTQGHRRDATHVLARDFATAFERGERTRRARDCYLASVAVDVEAQAEFGD